MTVEPRIQYAKTSDGANIAYWRMGAGAPLVWLPEPPTSHLQLERSTNMTIRANLADMLPNSVVALDYRGLGLSDRAVAQISMETRLLDIAAVVDALHLDEFALAATGSGCGAAAAYASAQPARVSRLILVNPYAIGYEVARLPRGKILAEALINDWEMFTETLGGLAFGWGTSGAKRYAEFMRGCCTHEAARHWFAAMASESVLELLAQAVCPTLVVHLSGLTYQTVDTARSIVAQARDGSLVVLEGTYKGNASAIRQAVAEFLSLDNPPPVSGAGISVDGSGVRTVLFTDLVGHTEMMRRLGDAKGRDVLREHERITRDLLKQHGGDEVKTMGDGFMASFGSVTKAMDCAIALQRAFAAHSESMPEPLHVRVGLDAGEPIEEDGDLFGATVIMASRVCAQAGAGEILIPEPVRHLLSGKSYVYADHGEFAMKGFDDAVRLYEVRWRE